MSDTIAQLECQLDDFNAETRKAALAELATMLADGKIQAAARQEAVNLHAHSFFSYNALGYSPSRIVWRARLEGLSAVGLVDFDVLDGVDEFFAAGELLNIRTTAGMETRVYVPEFADREISSPGEPGIAYQMGVGFVKSAIDKPEAAAFAEMLRTNARERNKDVVALVNAFLDPVTLDYDSEVLPLSPSGTPTERHLCAAYQRKAEAVFPDETERVAFWSGKLSTDAAKVAAIVNDDKTMQALIRSKTMKSGGPGYQAPTPQTFPSLADFNAFILAAGGIPTATWLDGTSAGEAALDELMDIQVATGAAMLNIIPDRNWNIADAQLKQTKLANLYQIVKSAETRSLPIIVGTEMNAPGLKFVDSFEAEELAPVKAAFLRGADILCGVSASLLGGSAGYVCPDGCCSETFADVDAKNAFFAELGRHWRR